MRNLLDTYLFAIPRNAADGAGGAGDAAGGSGTPAGGNPPAGDGGAPGSGSPDAAASPPAGIYFPEGLPDHFKGASDRETIDKLAGAWKDYRNRDAGRDVPETPDGYLTLDGIDAKAFTLDERFKGHIEALASDPGMKAAAEVAKKYGVERPAMYGMLQAAMGALQESGMLEPMVDVATERAALLPDAAKTLPKDQQDVAIDKRMNDNFAFIDLMVANRGLPKQVGEYAQMMLGDKAEGHLFLEFVRTAIQGGGQGPGQHGGQGPSISHAQLKERQADPRNDPNDPRFDPAFERETSRLYQQFKAQGGKFDT